MYENYAKIRDAKGLRDSDVSKATGIRSSVFSDWKNGRYNLRYDKLRKIADFLEVSVESFDSVRTNEQPAAYYLNQETAEIAQAIFENPDLRALFHTTRFMSKEDMRLMQDMAERLKGTNPDG